MQAPPAALKLHRGDYTGLMHRPLHAGNFPPRIEQQRLSRLTGATTPDRRAQRLHRTRGFFVDLRKTTALARRFGHA